jgi:hypothetical protein
MNRRAQIFCGWSGIASILLLVIGMGPVAQLTPPLPALVSAGEIAAHVTGNATNILIGMVMVNIGVALSIALVVGLAIEMRRIEMPGAPVLSYVQLTTGTVASLFLMLPAMIMSVAAFQPDRSADTLLLLHQLATFSTFMPFSVATLEAWVLAVVIFADKSATPVFPRWLGYYSVLAGLSYVPMGFIGLFKSGIWASDGVFGWWVPTILVAPWYLLLSICLIRRGGSHEADYRGTAAV